MSKRVGLWRAVGRLKDMKAGELLWPELTSGLLIGVGGGVWIVDTTHLDGRLTLVSEMLPLAGALLAVVFAGLALVVSIPSQDYIRAMAQVPGGGIVRFLDPFLIAVGTQVGLILLAFAYQAGAKHVTPPIEHAAFYVIGFLLVLGLLNIVALARSLVRHGVNRGIEALAQDEGDAAEGEKVPSLGERRRAGDPSRLPPSS